MEGGGGGQRSGGFDKGTMMGIVTAPCIVVRRTNWREASVKRTSSSGGPYA